MEIRLNSREFDISPHKHSSWLWRSPDILYYLRDHTRAPRASKIHRSMTNWDLGWFGLLRGLHYLVVTSTAWLHGKDMPSVRLRPSFLQDLKWLEIWDMRFSSFSRHEILEAFLTSSLPPQGGYVSLEPTGFQSHGWGHGFFKTLE